MNFLRLLPAMALLALVCACTSGVRRPDDQSLAVAQFVAPEAKAKGISLTLSENAKKQLLDNLGFNHEALLGVVKRALEAREILVNDPNAELPTIEIVLTDIRMRSHFSAVMWGVMAGADHVRGDVIVRDASGSERQRFTVSAAYSLGGIAGGQNDARREWLYEAFAKRTINELTGVPNT